MAARRIWPPRQDTRVSTLEDQSAKRKTGADIGESPCGCEDEERMVGSDQKASSVVVAAAAAAADERVRRRGSAKSPAPPSTGEAATAAGTPERENLSGRQSLILKLMSDGGDGNPSLGFIALAACPRGGSFYSFTLFRLVGLGLVGLTRSHSKLELPSPSMAFFTEPSERRTNNEANA
ncbi:hypothetical protein NL676_034306 [Syzygium grande]|nr:hypothetical protein NL676_034306 [Syzygium grande]